MYIQAAVSELHARTTHVARRGRSYESGTWCQTTSSAYRVSVVYPHAVHLWLDAPDRAAPRVRAVSACAVPRSGSCQLLPFCAACGADALLSPRAGVLLRVAPAASEAQPEEASESSGQQQQPARLVQPLQRRTLFFLAGAALGSGVTRPQEARSASASFCLECAGTGINACACPQPPRSTSFTTPARVAPG
jgi:hypothetical protein